MKFEVTILGSSSARFTQDRFQTSQIINHHERYFLIDCGEATQIQLSKYRFPFLKIDHIFISHLHGDHYFGLIGLINTMQLFNRTKKLSIYGPKGLLEIIEIQLKFSESELGFELHFTETIPDCPELLYEDDKIQISSFPLYHRIPCTGFLFKEKPKQRNIIKSTIPPDMPPLQIISLKNGNDVEWMGQQYLSDNCTTIPKKSYSYAYCSDTLYNENIVKNIYGSDWLYHEATFLHNMLDRALNTHHSTALQAGQIAKLANVSNLVIGHYSSRYENIDQHLTETKSVFEHTILAKEGLKINISNE